MSHFIDWRNLEKEVYGSRVCTIKIYQFFSVIHNCNLCFYKLIIRVLSIFHVLIFHLLIFFTLHALIRPKAQSSIPDHLAPVNQHFECPQYGHVTRPTPLNPNAVDGLSPPTASIHLPLSRQLQLKSSLVDTNKSFHFN